MSEYQPRYSGPHRIGICRCGHSWEDHHLGVVMNREYGEATGEAYVPQECEFFGFNETGGLDADGNNHCQQYKDQKESE
jgi:hypothetical protein